MKYPFIVDKKAHGLTANEQALVATIIDVVCRKFFITKEQFHNKSRRRPIVNARIAAAVIIYKKYNAFRHSLEQSQMPLADVGRCIGGKDHSTVLYYIRAHDNLMETHQYGYYEEYLLCEKVCMNMFVASAESILQRLNEISIMMTALAEERALLLKELKTYNNGTERNTDHPTN